MWSLEMLKRLFQIECAILDQITDIDQQGAPYRYAKCSQSGSDQLTQQFIAETKPALAIPMHRAGIICYEVLFSEEPRTMSASSSSVGFLLDNDPDGIDSNSGGFSTCRGAFAALSARLRNFFKSL